MAALLSTIGVTLDSRGVPEKIKKITDKGKQLEGQFKKVGISSTVAAKKVGLFGAIGAQTGAKMKIAALGVKAFDAAVKSSMLAMGGIAAGVAGLGAAFNTIKNVEFAGAKVRTLGTDSEELKKQLTLVSLELNQQVSSAELMAGAYDVASAGFTKAADAAKVLKAASLGATGGFSDLNTVGNAATSVLNAYGKSADDAMGVVDQFIQTQNDGKIIVAEYAANIGKVASVAATMKVPLKEVNAAIALTTAAGVKAEVAFTGMKTSLLRLGGERGGKKLEKLGIDISAATIESEGLLANLKKLEGLDIKALESIFGQEAIQVMAPVIANLEKYEQLIKNQENSAGAAFKAQATAANTIKGAWDRLAKSFTNLFADQNELGVAIKITLQGISAVIDILRMAVTVLLTPFRLAIKFLQGIADAFAEAFGLEKVDLIQGITDAWNFLLVNFEKGAQAASEATYKWATSAVRGFVKIKEDWEKLVNFFKEHTPQWIKDILGATKDVIEKTIRIKPEIETPEGVPETEGGKGKGKGGDSKTESAKKYAGVLDVIKEKWEQITDIVASGMTNAVMGLIDGTKSLGESLAGIAKSLASMFLNSAFKSMFDGMFPGMSSAEGSFNNAGSFKAFAQGGVTSGPTLGLIGEAGEPEYVIPSSKMQGAMDRYSAGARGQGVIPGGGTVTSGSGVPGGSVQIDYTGPILSFNSEDYLPRSAVPEIINSAARRGAEAGQTQVFSQLKNSRSQRSRIGL